MATINGYAQGQTLFGSGAFQVFRTSGTFTVPTGVKSIRVRVVGGGGGGAKSYSGYRDYNRSNGGAGGGFAMGVFSVMPGDSYAVTVAIAAAAETDGGSSSFGALISATGGQSGATYTPVGGVGVGGSVNYTGGAGGLGGYFGAGAGMSVGGGGGAASQLGNGGAGGGAAYVNVTANNFSGGGGVKGYVGGNGASVGSYSGGSAGSGGSGTNAVAGSTNGVDGPPSCLLPIAALNPLNSPVRFPFDAFVTSGGQSLYTGGYSYPPAGFGGRGDFYSPWPGGIGGGGGGTGQGSAGGPGGAGLVVVEW